MLETLLLWGFALLVGILALPAAGFLFARLPGRGLALARPLGLLLLAYPVWLLASVDVLPYRRWSPFLGLILLAFLSAGIWVAAGRPLPRGTSMRLWLAGEAVFTVAFFAWALLRSFAPDVWNTEKPMDMAFVNAVNRSEWFPPHDPWMSGESLNYYYFGHYVVALLIRATGIRLQLEDLILDGIVEEKLTGVNGLSALVGLAGLAILREESHIAIGPNGPVSSRYGGRASRNAPGGAPPRDSRAARRRRRIRRGYGMNTPPAGTSPRVLIEMVIGMQGPRADTWSSVRCP